MAIWRPRSPQPLGSLAETLAKARDTGHPIVIRALTGAKGCGSSEEVEYLPNQFGALDPGPVAGARFDPQLGAGKHGGVGGAEAGRQVDIAVAPDDQRRAGEPGEVLTSPGEAVRVGVAIE